MSVDLIILDQLTFRLADWVTCPGDFKKTDPDSTYCCYGRFMTLFF
jgi:hypothetical protein